MFLQHVKGELLHNLIKSARKRAKCALSLRSRALFFISRSAAFLRCLLYRSASVRLVFCLVISLSLQKPHHLVFVTVVIKSESASFLSASVSSSVFLPSL